MKKIVLLALVLVLFSTAMIGRFTKPVEASGTITIMVDGSVDPPTAPIDRDGDIYTLTGNITSDADGIVIERDNIILDGAGCTVQGTGVGFWAGIFLLLRSNVTIENLEIRAFYYGILSDKSSNLSICGNKIGEDITWGIRLTGESSDNTISGNTIANTNYGIELGRSSDSTIYENNIANNNYALNLGQSPNNRFYHNNFVNNTRHVYMIEGYVNFWDDGVEGNYWSNYTGVDLDHDGIGDSPHFIDGNQTDNYPLMGMFSDFTVGIGYQQFDHVHVISNSTVSNLQVLSWLTSPNEYFQAGQPFIRLYVTGEEGSVGFCRIMIPRVVLNDSYVVLVVETPYTEFVEVPFIELPIPDSTHAYIYFTYTHPNEIMVTIPEFPTWTSILLILIVLTVAIAIHKRRLLKTPTH